MITRLLISCFDLTWVSLFRFLLWAIISYLIVDDNFASHALHWRWEVTWNDVITSLKHRAKLWRLNIKKPLEVDIFGGIKTWIRLENCWLVSLLPFGVSRCYFTAFLWHAILYDFVIVFSPSTRSAGWEKLSR